MFFGSPSSQKAGLRPISFVLDDLASGTPPTSVDLVIRPEELTRTDSSRMSVVQTLGGAWADNFGPGLPQITISGHTGWRPQAFTGDGEARFAQLKTMVFDQYHIRKQAAVMAGRDPNLVQLIFSDALDNFSVSVAPGQFVLRRSKSRPLLMMYQIPMTVLDENANQLANLTFGSLFDDALSGLGLSSLAASISSIISKVQGAIVWVQTNIIGPVMSYVSTAMALYNTVYSAVANTIQFGDNVIGSIMSVAQTSAQAGANLFRMLASVADLPQSGVAALGSIANDFTNIFCVLNNALTQQESYQDYSSLFGSSNCSSTSGGRPLSVLSDENPFYSVIPDRMASPLTITPAAQVSMGNLANTDIVLDPMSSATLVSETTTVAQGFAVAAPVDLTVAA
jgi:hypothetical protein